MKTTLKIAALIVTVVLSSCGTNGLSVQKRKYNSGYHVAFGKHKRTNTVNNSQQEATSQEEKTVANKVIETKKPTNEVAKEETSYPLTASISDAPVVTSKSKSLPTKVKAELATGSSNVKAPVKISKLKQLAINKIAKKAAKPNSADDTMLILLVILCLFPILSLVAVFIKDGKAITTNFWITLLLHFIFLWWLFALLVVLDIVDLG